MLAKINVHPRDQLIIFDEGPHIYTVLDDLESKYVSCTTFIHHFFHEFNADLIINKMMKSSKWNQNRYFGMTANQIKQSWEHNRIEASTAGTQMHKTIESFYNQEITLDSFRDVPDMQHFIDFYQEYGYHLKPYRSEWMVFDWDLKLAGSIDFVTENEDGTLDIYDWKRSNEIKRENQWQNGKDPIQHLPDTNYWHYCLQLNIYKAILERNYQKQIRQLTLVVLHPVQVKYKLIPVVDLSREVENLFQSRKKELNSSLAQQTDQLIKTDHLTEEKPEAPTGVCLF